MGLAREREREKMNVGPQETSSLFCHLLQQSPQLWHHIPKSVLRKLPLQPEIRRPALLGIVPPLRKHIHERPLFRFLDLGSWTVVYFLFCYVEQLSRDYADEAGDCWTHFVSNLCQQKKRNFFFFQRQLTILS